MMPGKVTVKAYGTCGDNAKVDALGYGDSPAEAKTDANDKIEFQCLTKGKVKSYDSATIIEDTRPR